MRPLVDRFKEFYQNHQSTDPSRLDEIYSEKVVFQDPVHVIRGLPKVRDYLDAMYSGLTECRFEYLDQLDSDASAYIKWNMHYRHPKLNDKLITVRGVTLIHYSDRIDFHEDIYDMGSLLYEHLPVMGPATRWLKRRLASDSL